MMINNKNNFNLLSVLLLLIIVFSVPLFIISIAVSLVVDIPVLYEYGFTKYEISEITDISLDQLMTAGGLMGDYLSGNIPSPQLTVNDGKHIFELYNSKELTHLYDVRMIIQKFQYLMIISGLILLVGVVISIWRKQMATVISGIFWGAVITIVFITILVVWILIDFESIFYLFHTVSFNNDLWILDPRKDYLIKMFPQGFFNDAAILLVCLVALSAVVAITACLIISMKKSNQITIRQSQ